MDWNDFTSWWLANPWLVWGVGAYVSSAVGFLVTAVGLELLLHSGLLCGSKISYASSSHAPRDKLMSETHKRISFRYATCTPACPAGNKAQPLAAQLQLFATSR